jgi:hypothetical protein
MKSSISDPCSHNQHEFCKEQDCQCGCHYIKKNGGLTPEEFKAKMSVIAAMEGSV